MNIPETCIRRPVMTTLLMAGMVIFGFVAYRSLPVAELPNVDFPTIDVSARLPGASPETMAAAVATPLENQFSKIAGVRAMTSLSAEGTTRVTLEFELERNIDAAALDVQSAISASMRQLPPDISEPPAFRKVNPADFPIFFLSLTSRTLPISEVNEYAENVVSPRLSTIDGVAQLQIWGQAKKAVRVQVNPDLLFAKGVGIDEVEKALKAGNSFIATGSLSGPDKSISIKSSGQLRDAAAFKELIIKYVNGAPIRVKDIGTAVDGVENDKQTTWFGDNQGLVLVIYRQPGSNTVKIVDEIQRYLPQLRAQVPESVTLNVAYDRSNTIREGIHDVQFTLVLAAALVVLVIFLFLRSLSATIIASIALPISVIGTFALMYAWGFSINNLTLMALVLAVGFVVDDAIVMLENIVRHKEEGLSTFEAAIVGSREIGFTILSMTISLVAVFIPIIFMQGMIGRLLHEFALTITAAILVSGVVSITLTPMMCSRFVKSHNDSASRNPVFRWSEAFFDGMLKGYETTLRWCLARKPLILAVFVGTVVSTGYLYTLVQKDFLPEEDSGRLLAIVEAGQDASYEQLLRANKLVQAIAMQDPNIDSKRMNMRAGAGGAANTANSGMIFMPTLPPDKRPEPDVRKVVQGLRQKLNQIPNVKVFVTNPPIIRVGGRISNAQYQYTLQDVDLESLQLWSDRMTTEIAKIPGFQDVVSDLKISSPSVNVRIDRDKASTLGISPDLIEGALGSAFGNRKVSTIYTSASQYSVILEVDPKLQADPETIRRLFIRAPATGVVANVPGTSLTGTTTAVATNVPARLIPLDSLVKLDPGVASLTVSHQGQLPAVTISFNLTPDVSLGTAIDRIRALERQLQMPATMSTNFAGTAQVFESSLKGMGLLLLMAILVVYIILGILYESFIHPLTILSGLPAASMGALLTLIWFDKQLTLYAFVGIIMLVGIVKKNAIMMIDFALSAQRERNIKPEQAIFDACIVRFRPIMMTTFAALVGAVPIAMGFGQGGEARAPLGLTVVGGLVLSQIITLYLTPVIYIYFDRMQSLWQKSHSHAGEIAPSTATPTVRQAAE